MIIKVFSRQCVEAYVPSEKTIFISIRDPEQEKANIQKGWFGTIFLDFHDIDIQIGNYKLFNQHDADSIVMFMEECIKVLGKGITVVVNCEAGISRSAAIAIVLEKVYNKYDANKKYPFANRKVCSLLTERYWEKR